MSETPARPDVVCIGESMAVITANESVSVIAEGATLRLTVAGAESNVAMGLAQLGVSSAWWSRLGADALGQLVYREIADAGVDVIAERDPARVTAIMVKDLEYDATTVTYYRSGSAASAMGPADLDRIPAPARIRHLSGITSALSESADLLVGELLNLDDGVTTSFDVNYRARLWPVARAAPRLRELANRADIVFVGLDEARTLWSVTTPHDVRALLPQPERVIVKDSGGYASALGRDDVVFSVAAPPRDVIEVVGAGDAFAAGYLAGFLNRVDETAALRLGHFCAGRALATTADAPLLPEYASAQTLAESEHRKDFT